MMSDVSKYLFAFLFGLILPAAQLQAQADLTDFLSNELDREFNAMQEQDVPPYYLAYRVTDTKALNISGAFGSLVASDNQHSRTLHTTVRVGSYDFDNTHPDLGGDNWGGGGMNGAVPLPLDNDEMAIKQRIWRVTDMSYKSAVSQYRNLKNKKSKKDLPPDFSKEDPHVYEEAAIGDFLKDFDREEWERKIREYSAVFLQDKSFIEGQVKLDYVLERKYFIDSEGSRIVQNRLQATLGLQGQIVAEDGNIIPLTTMFHAERPEELPPADTIIAAGNRMVAELKALSKAPMAEPYTGPAILSAEAAGVFFHEIFGHRIEGHRLSEEWDGQTFKSRVGGQVLNKNLSVYSDPTKKEAYGKYLAGFYKYDEEGVPAQPVTVVEKGILRNFLMSRKPLEEFNKSNGHGRAAGNADAVSRQSNLFIKADKTISDAQLRNQLIRKCRKEGLEYGYYIREVAGGFTVTDRYQPNVFNIEPRKVYRIYTDGRQDELVRGVTLIGTPLVMFSEIDAAGDTPGVFTGVCGAESGGVPVSTIAPALLIDQVETQKEPEGHQTFPILPKPGTVDEDRETADKSIIDALRDELENNMEKLHSEEYTDPFFIAYSLNDHEIYYGSATLGAIDISAKQRFLGSNVRLMIGDYDMNDENFIDQSGPQRYNQGNIPLPLDNDYWGIRRSFWFMTDRVYKSARELYKKKVNILKTKETPRGFEPIPDFAREPVTKMELDRKEYRLDKEYLDNMLRDYSSWLRDYPEIVSSSVSLNISKSKHYFINSEGSRVIYPVDHSRLSVYIECLSSDKQPIFYTLNWHAKSPYGFPGRDSIENDIRAAVDSLMLLKDAPVIRDQYYGPVLFTASAGPDVLSSLLTGRDYFLAAQRQQLIADNQMNLFYGRGYGGEHTAFNQRVLPRNFNVKALTHLESYDGIPLVGNFEVDGEGVVPPKEITLVDQGILVGLLNSRTPTKEVPASNGHNRYGNALGGRAVAPGILDIEVTEGSKDLEDLKQDLIKFARDENLEYAYIVRKLFGQGILAPTLLYQVDLDTGAEKLVRINAAMDLPENSLRHISGISSDREVYQTTMGGGGRSSGRSGMSQVSGIPVSYILPSSIMLSNVTLKPIFDAISLSAPVVPNPAGE